MKPFYTLRDILTCAITRKEAAVEQEQVVMDQNAVSLRESGLLLLLAMLDFIFSFAQMLYDALHRGRQEVLTSDIAPPDVAAGRVSETTSRVRETATGPDDSSM